MIAVSFFLLGSQPASGGIEVREVQYYFQQALHFASSYHAALTASLYALCMSCNEIRTRSRLYDAQVLISALQAQSASPSFSPVCLLWTASLQALQAKRRAVFSFVLATLRFKKSQFYAYALLSLLSAWRCYSAHPLHHIWVAPSPSVSPTELHHHRGTAAPSHTAQHRLGGAGDRAATRLPEYTSLQRRSGSVLALLLPRAPTPPRGPARALCNGLRVTVHPPLLHPRAVR